MKLLVVVVIFYLAGLLLHLMYGSNELWYANIYYIWEKSKDLLFLILILCLIPIDKRWIVKPLIFYASLRILWEMIKPFTNLATDNPQIIKGLFMGLLIGVISLLIKDLRERCKPN